MQLEAWSSESDQSLLAIISFEQRLDAFWRQVSFNTSLSVPATAAVQAVISIIGPVKPRHGCLEAHGAGVGVRFAIMQRNLMAAAS